MQLDKTELRAAAISRQCYKPRYIAEIVQHPTTQLIAGKWRHTVTLSGNN